MAWDAHFVTWFGEEVIVFGASFFGSRFDSVGSPGELVFGDEVEELFVESGSFSGEGGLDGGGVVAHGVEAAFEAEGSEVHIVFMGCFLHDQPDEVVADGVHAEFFFYHRGGFAAQGVGSHARFDFAQAQFDVPSRAVEFGEHFEGVFFGVEEGGDEGDFPGAKTGLFYRLCFYWIHPVGQQLKVKIDFINDAWLSVEFISGKPKWR